MFREHVFLQNAALEGHCEELSSDHIFNIRNVFGAADMNASQT